MGRVTVHIEGARGWLARAAREWDRGCRARALLDLSLAEAEVRLARHAAATEPVPAPRKRTSGAAVALAAAALAVGLFGSLRAPTSTRPPQSAAPPAVRTVSLGYIPGGVLALVAPDPGSPSGGGVFRHTLLGVRPGRALGPVDRAGPAEEDGPWLRALLREVGLQGEEVPAVPVSFR